MKKTRKILAFSSILAILAMMLLIAASCDQNEASIDNDVRPVTETETPVVETEEYDEEPIGRWTRIDPNLPERDFDGYEFNILSWYVGIWGGIGGNDGTDIWVEELTGEALNDAVWHRNNTIEEQYNIRINKIRMDINAINNAIRNTVAAGDNAYDVVYQRLADYSSLITGGLLVNLHSIPYLNFDQPWWDSRSISNLSIAGRAFVAASDIITTDKNTVSCVLFNKQFAQDFAFDDLYDVVRRGEWTIDYMTGISRGLAMNLDGSGVLGVNCFIPIVGEDLTTMILFAGAGSSFASHDAEGIPYSSFFSERNLLVMDTILDMMYDSELYMNWNMDAFENNRAIFLIRHLREVINLRAFETDFGVLPVPKFDASQENHYSMINIHHAGLLSVPLTAPDLERTGILLEALSAESRFTVMPAYYDLALVGRFLRDDESEEMLDIIFDTRVYDLGDLFGFGGFPYQILRIYRTRGRDIASMYERAQNVIQRDIERLVDRILDID